jgi:hypothetical protein
MLRLVASGAMVRGGVSGGFGEGAFRFEPQELIDLGDRVVMLAKMAGRGVGGGVAGVAVVVAMGSSGWRGADLARAVARGAGRVSMGPPVTLRSGRRSRDP